MSRFFFDCLSIGAVCGMVGGLIDSPNSTPRDDSASIAPNSLVPADFMRISLLAAWSSYYVPPSCMQELYTGCDPKHRMKTSLQSLIFLSLATGQSATGRAWKKLHRGHGGAQPVAGGLR